MTFLVLFLAFDYCFWCYLMWCWSDMMWFWFQWWWTWWICWKNLDFGCRSVHLWGLFGCSLLILLIWFDGYLIVVSNLVIVLFLSSIFFFPSMKSLDLWTENSFVQVSPKFLWLENRAPHGAYRFECIWTQLGWFLQYFQPIYRKSNWIFINFSMLNEKFISNVLSYDWYCFYF